MLRVYTDKRWDFTLNDVNFVQAMACLAGLAIVMARQYKGMKDSLEFLKSQRGVKTVAKGAPREGSGSAPVRKAVKKKK